MNQYQAQAGAPKPDSLAQILEAAHISLCESEDLIRRITGSIEGPRPEKEREVAVPTAQGIHTIALEINNRAKRIHEKLGELSNRVG